jgi:hypothetical protein
MSTKMRSRWLPPIPRVPGIQCLNRKRSEISSRERRVVRLSTNGNESLNMILLIEPGVTTGLNRLVIFVGPGPSDRLDDYVFRISEMCRRVFVTGDKFGRHRRHGIEAQSRNNRKRCIDLSRPEMCVVRPCVQPCSCHGGKPDMS